MNKKIILSTVAALSISTVNAYEMKPVGFKAMGMGGTGVASTRGSLSGYYNPALLRFSDYTAEFSINAGIRIRESNLVDNVDQLDKLEFENTMSNIKSGSTLSVDVSNINSAKDVLSNIGVNNALTVTATPAVAVQLSDSLAIGVYANADVSLRLNIDSTRLSLIYNTGNGATGYQEFVASGSGSYVDSTKSLYDSSSLEYAVDNGKTYIDVKSLVLVETPISYARAYDFNSGTYSFGVSVKPMSLTTFKQKVNIGKSVDEADNEDGQYETKYKPTIGVDLGIAYIPTDSKITFGLVGKNLNSPKFKVDTTSTNTYSKVVEDYKIDPYFRAGMSVSILEDNAELAFDADLQKSDTLIDGEKSQNIGVGLELHPSSWFSWRVGAMQDIAAKKFDEGTIFTTGVGFGLKWAQIDLSAMVSSKSGEYDGDSIPRYAALNLSLVSRWGDGYNTKEAPEEDMYDKVKNREELTPAEKRRIEQQSLKAQEDLDRELLK